MNIVHNIKSLSFIQNMSSLSWRCYHRIHLLVVVEVVVVVVGGSVRGRVVTPGGNGVFTSVEGWLGLCGEYGENVVLGWKERSRDGVSGFLECLIGS